MCRLTLLIALTTLLSCAQAPISDPEKPSLETGTVLQEPVPTIPEVPTKEPLPEPWVMDGFEGKIERWIRGTRTIQLEQTEYFGCGSNDDATCNRQIVLASGRLNADGSFKIVIPKELLTKRAYQTQFACSNKPGEETRNPNIQFNTFQIHDFKVSLGGKTTGIISDLAVVGNHYYPELQGNEFVLTYADQDVSIQGFCQIGTVTKTNLNLKKGWNLTKKAFSKQTLESRWYTPTTASTRWYYNPSTISLKIDSPSKTLRIGESMSGVSLRLVDSDPVSDVPNIQGFKINENGYGWTFNQSTLTAKKRGFFDVAVSNTINGVQYDFRADSDTIQMFGIEAQAGAFNIGQKENLKTIVRLSGTDKNLREISFKTGDQIEITYPDGTKISSVATETSHVQELILDKPFQAGRFNIRINNQASDSFVSEALKSKGYEKPMYVFPLENVLMLLENRSGYGCVSENFKISITDLQTGEAKRLYPQNISPTTIIPIVSEGQAPFSGCSIKTNPVSYSKPHQYRIDWLRYEYGSEDQFMATLDSYEFSTE